MITAGLDVGSRTIALVLFDERVLSSTVVDTGVRPLARCRELLAGRDYARLMVTGYGRHLVAGALGGEIISEISAFATGASHLYPDCRTVIDIGGQDCKVISLAPGGGVTRFEMNDRCAAGTGKFLEVMAATLELNMDEFAKLACSATREIQINSLCTVFAESEVVSLIGRGEDPAAIALALHQAVATRVSAMMKKVGVRERVVFAGGGALNDCLKRLLGDRLGVEITVPESPQTVGALGAARLAQVK